MSLLEPLGRAAVRRKAKRLGHFLPREEKHNLVDRPAEHFPQIARRRRGRMKRMHGLQKGF